MVSTKLADNLALELSDVDSNYLEPIELFVNRECAWLAETVSETNHFVTKKELFDKIKSFIISQGLNLRDTFHLVVI